MIIERIILGVCQTNCYYIHKEDSTEVLVIDPGDQGQLIYNKITEKGLHIAAILLTHAHFDHIMGAKKLREVSGAKIYAYEKQEELLKDPNKNLSDNFGSGYTLDADVYFRDKTVLELAGMKAECIATPGHTSGDCCYYFAKDKVLFSGDALFKDSIGRTDFPTGSYAGLVHSIVDRLMILSDDVCVYSGHGEETTIGHERRYNAFIQ